MTACSHAGSSPCRRRTRAQPDSILPTRSITMPLYWRCGPRCSGIASRSALASLAGRSMPLARKSSKPIRAEPTTSKKRPKQRCDSSSRGIRWCRCKPGS
jgi:hypothetical protein